MKPLLRGRLHLNSSLKTPLGEYRFGRLISRHAALDGQSGAQVGPGLHPQVPKDTGRWAKARFFRVATLPGSSLLSSSFKTPQVQSRFGRNVPARHLLAAKQARKWGRSCIPESPEMQGDGQRRA